MLASPTMAGSSVITPAVRRTRALLVGGLVGGHLGSVLAVLFALGWGGPKGLVSALIGAGLVIVFFSIGQAIEIVAITMASTLGLVATLFSYVMRVILLGIGLRAVVGIGTDRIEPAWVFCPALSGQTFRPRALAGQPIPGQPLSGHALPGSALARRPAARRPAGPRCRQP